MFIFNITGILVECLKIIESVNFVLMQDWMQKVFILLNKPIC